MTRARFLACTLLTVCLAMAGPVIPGSSALAQDAAPEAEAPVAPPKPKKKPAPRRAAPPIPTPMAKTPMPEEPAAPPTRIAKLPEISVVCDAKAALYAGDGDVSVWVTRSGAIVVDNPLRPLTPETTRVLQVVIGGKVATAYGPDLLELRRGGTPAGLEAATGGPIRWDETLSPLPDALNLVTESGQALARIGFRECGEAPAVKAAPAVAGRPARPRKPAARPPEGTAKAPGGLQIPQGVIP